MTNHSDHNFGEKFTHQGKTYYLDIIADSESKIACVTDEIGVVLFQSRSNENTIFPRFEAKIGDPNLDINKLAEIQEQINQRVNNIWDVIGGIL